MSDSGVRGKVVVPVFAIALPFLVLIAVIEAGLRLSGFRSPVLRAEMLSVNAKDELLPYVLRPGFKGDYGGGSVTVSPSGNRIVPLPESVEERSISGETIILGDSVVFGQGLDDKDTIAANLQTKILANAHGGSKASRVVMIAAPGFTSWNEHAALFRYVNLAKARTVVLIYVNNDITKDNDHFKFGEVAEKIYYLEGSRFRQAVRALYDHSRLFYIVSASIERIRYLVRQEKSAAAGELDRDALSYSMDAIALIKALCCDQGINFVVAIYRDGNFYRSPDQVAEYERAVSSGLSDISVDHFVLRWATERLSKSQFSVSWNDASHPSTRASEIIASEIAEELKRRGY
jgi:hypothetical protein